MKSEKNEEEHLLQNDSMEIFDTFGPKENKESVNLLNTANIKKELKLKSSSISNFSTNKTDNKFTDNIFKLLIIIIAISSFFFLKQKLINLKHNYLSDKTLFHFNVFYSEPKNNFLMFIILVCCFTVSSGSKLMILQMLTYILCLLMFIIKYKITNQENIFEKNLVSFHCADMIISFLYLGEKLIQICEDNSFHISILSLALFVNYCTLIYFVLVEIINCIYDDAIIDIICILLITIALYYSIFYVMKIKIWPKKIISFFIIRNLLITFIICLIILISSFAICSYADLLQYFFVNKILMKIIGILAYLIFEMYFIFKDKEEKKQKYFNLYNIYSNTYLYSKTSVIKIFIRVTIILLLEHFLLYKLDFAYKENMEIFKCIIIIILDISHGFIVMFIIKYIFNLVSLNNTDLLNIDSNSPFMRYGSFSNLNEGGDHPLIFE